MAITTVKIPKKFKNICDLICDGKEEGLQKLSEYKEFEHQKIAVLAELEYFNGNFNKALDYDMQICPFFGEWNYSNIREEHVAAMTFAAKEVKRENEVIDFFVEQISFIESDFDVPEHIKNSYKKYYEIQIEILKTGTHLNYEIYVENENPSSIDELITELKNEKKKLDIKSSEGQYQLLSKCCSKGNLKDMLLIYEQICDDNLSTWHMKALIGYKHLGNDDKVLEVVLRMAKQRLWRVASHTQVRPMEFFTHSALWEVLKDKSVLEKIVQASSRN
ncbi:MAG: hypothetical protein ACK5IJ_05190 [Mangrovibacterium sp.]